MAVKFLTNLDLNGNQLLNARLQVLASDPGTAVAGDIIYNSSTNVFKFYNGTDWIDPSLGGISGSGTIGTIPIFVTNTTTIGNSPITTTGNRANFLDGIRLAGGNLETSTNSGTFLAVNQGLLDKNLGAGASGQLLSSTGTQVSWINAPVSYTKWIAKAGSTTQDVNDGDSYSIEESALKPGIFPAPVTKLSTVVTQPLSLWTKNMTLASPSTYSTDVLLWGTNSTGYAVQKTHIEDIPVSAWGAATASINMDTNAIIGLPTPTLPTMAANKAYVDGLVAGGVTVKGGFNATTGITAPAGTNLYTNTAIAIGDYYIVTVAGNFFGQTSTPLTPGDSVIALNNVASGSTSITDFAVIQSDTDLATATTVGIGNVNVNTTTNNEGLSLQYANGTATVGFNIKNNLTTASGLADDDAFAMFQGSAGSQGNFSITSQLMADYFSAKNSFKGTSTSGTTHTFTHNLNSLNVTVQLIDNTSGDTAYATVERPTANVVVATTSASASLTCLIQKIP